MEINYRNHKIRIGTFTKWTPTLSGPVGVTQYTVSIDGHDFTPVFRAGGRGLLLAQAKLWIDAHETARRL